MSDEIDANAIDVEVFATVKGLQSLMVRLFTRRRDGSGIGLMLAFKRRIVLWRCCHDRSSC